MIAGEAAAAACGFPVAGASRRAQRSLATARRFQDWLWRLHDPGPQALDEADPAALLCRCEEISIGAFNAALEGTETHIGAIKSATRLGMGCCQGRYCGPAAARLHAMRRGRPVDDLSYFAPQVPVKPVSVEVVQATAEAIERSD